MSGFKLFVVITFKLTSDPNKYAPPSPKKIFADGKLNRRKVIKTIIWVIKTNENWKFSLSILTTVKIKFIIIRLIVNSPLKPSIRFAPFITNKKHKSTNRGEKKRFSKKNNKKGISMLKILIGSIKMNIKRRVIIINNLCNGFILIFKSSKKPIKNIEYDIKI